MTGGTTTTLGYDAEGLRVSKQVGAGTPTRYLVDTMNPTGYGQVLVEYTGDGASRQPARTYTYGLDLISQRTILGGLVEFFSSDVLGTTRFLTKFDPTPGATGGLNGDLGELTTQTFNYDAYGMLVGSTTATAYLYTGEQWDTEVGAYYLRARWYLPEWGRFLSRDTYDGGQGDPLSLHKYLYVHANPVNGIDPSGHFGIFKFTREFGDEAHRVIEAQYQAEHPGAIVGPRTSILSTGLKPDIFNGPARKYAEIKPLSLPGVAAGIAQIGMYEMAFAAEGFRTGVRYSRDTWPDGVRGAHVFSQPIAYFNVAGVIFYTDMTSNVDDLVKITTYAAAREFIRRGLVQRTLQGALIRIPGLVTARGVADSGRLQMHVGLAVMLRF